MKDKRNVRILNSINSVRLRPGMFIGDTSNCNHLIHEMLDNALDEIRNKYGNSIGVAFYKRGDIIIQDNGRGLPSGETIDENTGLKVDALESLFTKLHSGTKFSFESDQLESLFGQNGVGLVAVNALSEYVDIKSKDNHYKFVNSELCLKEKTQPDSFWSTEIKFKPSSEYFKSIYPDYTVFKNRLELAQAKLQNINIFINNKKLPKETMECFVRRQLKISSKTPLFYCEYSTKKMQVIEPGSKKIFNLPANIGVFLTYEPGETIILGDINLRFCEGTHLNSIINVIKSNILNKLDKKFAKTPERFLIEGIRLYVTAQIPFPQFDSQTKTRLVTDIKKDLIESGIDGKIIKILNEDYIKKTITSILNQKISNVNKIAKKKISSDNKLCDCLEHPGDVLYIIEGDSAAAPVRECRDAKVEAYLPLRGKVINVEKQSLAKIKENKEIKNIIEAVGQYPYRYNKIKVISDADCLSGDTLITYKDINGIYNKKPISEIHLDEIQSVPTFNFITQKYEDCKVNKIINKVSNKPFIEFSLHTAEQEKIRAYTTHGFPVYNIKTKKIEFLNANQIDKNTHTFISNKPYIKTINNEKRYQCFVINKFLNLYGIIINDIIDIGQLNKAYCLEVEKNHNFFIGPNDILTFNCDGLHINVLVILIISKFFPEIIKEKRLSIILPPLYGAYKNKSFIPLYSIDDVSKYKENGYTIQRFKGLGEMNSDQMRIIFNSNIEYIVKESKNIEETIKIILDSEIKRQYLNRDEYNFNTFIENVFKNIKSI